MNIFRIAIQKCLPAAVAFHALVCWGYVAYSQNSEISAPRKFDSFEDSRTSDVKARLDLFAEQLNREPRLGGVIVGYRPEAWRPGPYLRDIYGYRDYLVNMRGQLPERVNVIDGDIGEQRLTELWLVPPGASPPNVQKASLQLKVPMQFDQLSLGFRCQGEYTLVLEEPRDSMKLFAAALRDNPSTKGFLVVHPSWRGSLTAARRVATSSRELLIRDYGILAERVVMRVDSPRYCLEINSWLAPADVAFPKSASLETLFHTQLMGEAEKEQYRVRRIELIGNANTRDQVIRRRLLQNEGDIFSRKLLEQSLRNVSTLTNFSPVRLQDVEVHLSKNDKTIDFLINLHEHTPSRKRRVQ